VHFSRSNADGWIVHCTCSSLQCYKKPGNLRSMVVAFLLIRYSPCRLSTHKYHRQCTTVYFITVFWLLHACKAPAKRSHHANATYRNTVERNMHVACVWPPCCDMLGAVGASLKMIEPEPTASNTSQHSGQTHTTCCAQQCCDMLC